jgi:hypothetical protein
MLVLARCDYWRNKTHWDAKRPENDRGALAALCAHPTVYNIVELKFTVAQPVKKFPTFQEIRSFIIAFRKVHYCNIS